MKSCPACGGSLAVKRVRYLHDTGGQMTIIENLPAMVCERCGEQFYPPEALDTLVKMIRRGHPPMHDKSVYVYDASEVG
ncbi:MAG: YgiT-type zinc finger protein [bacterium]|nr:YgiT-type zinc finger protein [bacterium]